MSTTKSETFVDDGKSQAQLEEELGVGVEKTPILPQKPKLEKVNLDLTGAVDIASIISEIAKLPDPKRAEESTKKHDEYEKVAKRIWVIKMADKDFFTINLHKVKNKHDDGRVLKFEWERDDKGRIVNEPKTFYYNGMTIQEKDEYFRLISERESISYDLSRTGDLIKRLAAKDPDTLTDSDKEQLDKKFWVEIAMKYNKANQEFYISTFKAYFGATDEDIERMDFNDIIYYGEIGEYKEGIKSPLYGGL